MSLSLSACPLGKGIASAVLLLGFAIIMTTTTTAHAQNAWLDPAHGTIDVHHGFERKSVSLQAGGQHRASAMSVMCSGYIADVPAYTINMQGNDSVPLVISARSSADTTLVVSAPNGLVYCNDDTSGINPALSIQSPLDGQYAVWVGTYFQVDTPPSATLNISAGRAGDQPPQRQVLTASAAATFEVASFDPEEGGTRHTAIHGN